MLRLHQFEIRQEIAESLPIFSKVGVPADQVDDMKKGFARSVSLAALAFAVLIISPR